MTILREFLCVVGGLVTKTFLEKKGINLLSLDGVMLGIVIGLIFVWIVECLFR